MSMNFIKAGSTRKETLRIEELILQYTNLDVQFKKETKNKVMSLKSGNKR